jgi:glyoxylate reductase
VPQPLLVCKFRPEPEEAFRPVAEAFDVHVTDGPVRPWVLEGGDPDAIWSVGEVIDIELLDAAPRLRVVVNHGVGYDTIDAEELDRRGIALVRPLGANAGSVADHAFALLLAVRHRLIEADRAAREGRYAEYHWELPLGEDLEGTTLGIVGMGAIGRAMARRAEGFGMRVLVHSRSQGVPLDELLRESDAVSLHCPLTERTRGMIGRRELSLMRPTAVIINTARGAICDEDALVAALQEGTILGAGLDVVADEPHVPQALLDHPRVVITPHVADGTVQTQAAMSAACAEGLLSEWSLRAGR